jgi:hypothetical protein
VLGLVIVVRMLLNPPPAAQVQIRWTIRSEPADAEVVDATGQVLGKTPFAYTRARGAGVDVLSVRHEGYAEQRVALAMDRNGNQSVVLTQLAKAPPPPTEATAKPLAEDDPPTGEHQRKRPKKSEKLKKAKKKNLRHGSTT